MNTKNMKFTNIESELPNLQPLLKNSLQGDVLDIRGVDGESEKYHFECQNCPLLNEAKYVVFSPHMDQKYQSYEHYVFLAQSGKTLCHKSGKDFNLFDMLKPCINLKPAEPIRSKY
mgnify:FL=1